MARDRREYSEKPLKHTSLTTLKVKLLRLGIEQLRDETDANKIPWKKVTEFIIERGGTYKFGPATCKKKWLELFHGEETETDG